MHDLSKNIRLDCHASESWHPENDTKCHASAGWHPENITIRFLDASLRWHDKIEVTSLPWHDN